MKDKFSKKKEKEKKRWGSVFFWSSFWWNDLNTLFLHNVQSIQIWLNCAPPEMITKAPTGYMIIQVNKIKPYSNLSAL